MNEIKNLQTPIFQLTVGEFLEILNQEQRPPVPNPTQIPEFFGIDEFCKITGYKKASVYAKTSRHEIPHFKRDGKLVFGRDTSLNWYTANPVPTISDHCEMLDNKLLNRKRR